VSLEQAAVDLVAYAHRLEADGLALGTSGNLSVRSGEQVAITPSAVPYKQLSPELICVVDIDGAIRHAPGKASTELPMHLAAYRATGATAVVHTHPPYATTLSTIVDELPAIHYLIAFLGGPVRVVAYATPGTEELAARVAAGLKDRTGVLLQNHGALTVGPSLDVAYEHNRLLEWLCALYYRARAIGDPRILTEEELRAMAEELRRYGSQ
jgi:L-fuculose-phosphate aldolase